MSSTDKHNDNDISINQSQYQTKPNPTASLTIISRNIAFANALIATIVSNTATVFTQISAAFLEFRIFGHWTGLWVSNGTCNNSCQKQQLESMHFH